MEARASSILHVEDNPGDIRLVQELLAEAQAPFEISCADRLETTFDLLSREDFDLLLLDLQLPDSRGVSTVETIHSQAPGTPIVLLTGSGDESLVEAALSAGALDYLPKRDLETNLLLRVLTHALERAALIAEEREARFEARAGNARLAFLREVDLRLLHASGYESTLEAVVQLLVPRLADWCGIDIFEPGGVVRSGEAAHGERPRWSLTLDGPGDGTAEDARLRGVLSVLSTGRSQLYPGSALAASDPLLDSRLHRLLDDVGLSSAIVTPLELRGRQLGAMTLVLTESGRWYGEEEVALAEDFARRCSLAIDSARTAEEMAELRHAKHAVDTLSDGVVVLDGAGVVRLWNPAAEAITGLTAESVLNRRADRAIPDWEAFAASATSQASPLAAGSCGRTVLTFPGPGNGQLVDRSGSAPAVEAPEPRDSGTVVDPHVLTMDEESRKRVLEKWSSRSK